VGRGPPGPAWPDYLRPEDDDLGEPTVEVTEDTPRDDDSVEKDDRADTDDLDEYKAFVREVAIDMGTAQGWCDDGVNGVLEELGLDRKTRKYRVRVRVEAYQYVDVEVEAENADEPPRARSTRTRVNDEVDAYAGTRTTGRQPHRERLRGSPARHRRRRRPGSIPGRGAAAESRPCEGSNT
jgi:hypothetical protein